MLIQVYILMLLNFKYFREIYWYIGWINVGLSNEKTL